MARESDADGIEARRVVVAAMFEEGARRETQRAEPVQNRFFVAANRRHRRVGVQRVVVAGQAKEQGLARACPLLVDAVGRAGWHVLRRRWAALAAEAAQIAKEQRLSRRRQLLAIFQTAGNIDIHQQAASLVENLGDPDR